MVTFAPDRASFMLSPSDITAAATCTYGWLRGTVDPALGRAPRIGVADAFLERVSRLGDEHESRVLARLEAERGGDQVVRLARPERYTPEGVRAARERTAAALAARPAVVFQGMLHDGAFGGLADFLVLRTDEEHPEGAYEVVDTKLARHARVTALLQIAAYADLLDGMGVPRTRQGSLWLGDGSRHVADLDEVIPVYRHQRARLEALLQDHVAAGEPARWGDDRLSVCGACEACEEAVAEHRDVLLTAGATRLQRTRLREAGITTIEQLAASVAPPEGMARRTWEALREQAAIQLEPAGADGLPPHRIVDPRAVAGLPAPDAGDVFFDFEGDPLWVSADGSMEGLEYLWGWVEAPGGDTARTASADFRFTGLWADTRAAERAALEQFVAFVEARRATHPGMRIYHYAAYEVTALKRLTVRHGVGERELDDWLRAGLFVDLYSTVRAALRAGVPSYSIKKLEPLYMGAEHRAEDGVTTAADSVTEYHRYVAALEAGDTEVARAIRADIEDYNRYDCVSTARLRDWLLAQVEQDPDASRSPQGAAAEPETPLVEPAPEPEQDLTAALLAMLPQREEGAALGPGERGVALLAAGLGFYRREEKPTWWAFFDRGISPVDEWQEPRANVVADRVDVEEDWHQPTARHSLQRVLQVTGRLEPGTLLKPDASVKTVYEDFPAHAELQPNAVRWIGPNADVEQVEDLPDGRSVLRLRERLARGVESFDQLPMAAFEHSKVPTDTLEARIRELAVATDAAGALPEPGVSACVDILARRTPATTGRPLPEIVADAEGELDRTALLVEALESARGSYVAVQGPPGTGKTHVGSHAVKALLERGWSVGVTAQSHAVVENFLGKLVSIGVPKKQVLKAEKRGKDAPERPWATVSDAKPYIGLPGHVVGGTAWTFAHEDVQEFDLLVIDEAGQFSLAHTLAAAAMARTVLLLGDPQQLPQVTKGTHPQPIGDAALTWIAEGAPVLRPDRGFFLDTSWRMHSTLTHAVSELSYAGRLRSHTPRTDARRLDGVEPGLHPWPVSHTGNAVSSPEEAAAVVEIIRSLLGRTWSTGPDDPGRPLEPSDVIVVAPYNAQVAAVREALDAAGLEGTAVGTVDKFQGREAAVAILTMAASSPQEVPRGLDFLLNRNRLNVSISRGQWAAYLVHSPALADALPTSPEDLPMIGAFLRLVHR
ncbi:TM0106 family RecB-like putative nuclease [Micrococcus sp. HSID17228]|uniref:TM0106 family RecB-like putative nuclease n=1 Tax=unclassified Micrococcus TaxID=2620948 RepID=UPI000FAAC598|nr:MULTISPECIES: bifunctional RecB family nuclease/DEAD/DEAH box helicase [unclassified Micrococcus]RUQ43683.1 TM0106 family RecB-like putative nuclease [Micrococcus sp. HSID17227]RUQ45542.1 TM0106 family RecB-like putative nuclease [Micrococcus sp. HSID17228]